MLPMAIRQVAACVNARDPVLSTKLCALREGGEAGDPVLQSSSCWNLLQPLCTAAHLLQDTVVGLRQQGNTLVITNTNSSKYPDKSFSVNPKQAGDCCL